MQQNVITAGPSAGKTTTLRELSARGHYIVPEAARLYIDQEISEGRDEEEVLSDPDFQEDILQIDRRLENNIPEDQDTVFMDRSLMDNAAYLRYFGDTEVPQTGIAKKPEDLRMAEQVLEDGTGRYDNVFMLEQLPFEDDYARREDPQQAKELHEELRDAYQDAGYNPIDIELAPVDQRADEIMQHI
jgi:Predicted ATPase